MGGSAGKVNDVTALPSRHKMADMCYYGNVMTTTRWWLCVTMETFLHLQQYSHRLNLFSFAYHHYYHHHRHHVTHHITMRIKTEVK